MSRRLRLSTLLLATAVAVSAGGYLPIRALQGEAWAQAAAAKKEEKKKQQMDLKRFEIEQNREKYGEKANVKRGEAIAQLKILLERPLGPEQKAEMLMRLAELYWEQSKYEYATEMRKYDEEYEKWFNLAAEQQKKQAEPKVEATRSTAYTRKAIENYRVILQNYPNYPRIDEALFFLAFSLGDVGEEEESRDMYEKLVKNYPRSSTIPDAYNALGEYFFNHNNAYKALQNFKKAAGFKESRIYTYALYKLAWCYFNVGEHEQAITTMDDLVKETDRRIEAEGVEAGISLKEEALRDMVTFFAEIGDLAKAKEYFTRLGEKRYYRQMLSRLGGIYKEQGKTDEAIETYRTLIAETPNSPDNAANQDEIVNAYWNKDRFDEANEEINRLVESYGRNSSWTASNKENKEAVKEAERLIEKNLYKVATDSHQQALKRKAAKLLQLAEENYKRYLDYFSGGQRSYEMRFWYAEVLYKLKKFDVAADEYERVVDADGKGKFLKDAAINTIFSIDEFIKSESKKWIKETDEQRKRQLTEKDPKKKYASIPLREWESRLIKACDTYARVLPNDDKTFNVRFRAADLLFDHNEFKLANERFLDIIRANPKSQLAQDSVHTILNSSAKIEDWLTLNAAAREFYNNPDVGKTEAFKGELLDIYSRASFKIAESQASEEKFSDAARGFDAFYREFPKSEVRDLALYNASFYFGRAGDRGKQVELRREFVETFPKPVGKESAEKQLFEKSLILLAQHYESLADYKQAADLYRRLFDANPKFAADGFGTSQDSLYNSALFRQSLGDVAGAVKDFTDYTTTWPEDPEVLSTRMRTARILKDAKKTDEAMAAYKVFWTDLKLQKSHFSIVMQAWVEYGRLQGVKGDRVGMLATYGAALKYFDGAVKGFGGNVGQAPFYAAEMRFELLETRFAEYAKISMPSDPKKSGPILKQKTADLQGLEKAYVEVLQLKQGESGIAALFRIGTLYGDFATKLREAPCPPKLTQDQCEIYKFGLEDRAYPLIDKAVDAYTKAREKSYELGLYTEYTRKSLQELTRLRPEEYPAGAERLPAPDYTSNPLSIADFAK